MVVRERARLYHLDFKRNQRIGIFEYTADGTETDWVVIPPRIKDIQVNHCVPNGCFKELARIKRKVLRVWYERVQDISWDDCKAEGISWINKPGEGKTFKAEFHRLWESIYPGSWERNDWVECIEFEGPK
jgi:hypothetical protein